MDLDDDELKATRKLNGVDKERDIEKDIKRCEELTKPEHANWIGISNQFAIAGILKRIKELEEKYLHEKLAKEEVEELLECSIPIKRVKDKIEKNNKIMIDTQNKYPSTYAMLDEWRNAKAQNDILEKLVEDK